MSPVIREFRNVQPDPGRELRSMRKPKTLAEVYSLAANSKEVLSNFNHLLQPGHRLSASDFIDALLGRAQQYFFLGTPDALKSARSDLEQALEELSKKDPSLIDGQKKESEILGLFVQISILSQDHKQARIDFRKWWEVCKRDRELALDYVDFLQKCKQEGDHKELEEICDHFLREDPNDSDVLYIRAKVHYSSKKYFDAFKDCDLSLLKAKHQRFDRIPIHHLAARSCLELKTAEVALQLLNIASRLDLSVEGEIERSKIRLDISLLKLPCTVFTNRMIDLTYDTDRRRSIQKFSTKVFGVYEHLMGVFEDPFDHLNILLGHAIACIFIRGAEKFLSAHQSLELALKLSASTKYADFNQALIYEWLGELCNKEGNTEDALMYWAEGWKICKNCISLFDKYVGFLVNTKKDFVLATKICDERRKIDPRCHHAIYFQARIDCSLEKKNEELQNCEAFLENSRSSPTDCYLTSVYAMQNCLRAKDYKNAYRFAVKAYEFGAPEKLIDQFKKMIEIRKKLIEQANSPNEIPALPSLSPICQAAALIVYQGKDYETALSLYEYLLENIQAFDEEQRVQVFMGHALACIRAKKHLVSAHKSLAAASLLVPRKSDERRIQILHYRATLYAIETADNEALESFRQGWELIQTNNSHNSIISAFINEYILFLTITDQIKEALKLCDEANIPRTTKAIYKAQLYVKNQEPAKAIRWFDECLKQDPSPKFIKESWEAAWEMKNYNKAKKYINLLDRENSDTPFPEWMKMRLDTYRADQIDEHLKKVCQMPHLQIPHLTLLLQTYQKELLAHPRHHIHLLIMRAEKYKALKEGQNMVQDLEQILKIYDANRGVFEKKERAEAEKKLTEAKQKLPPVKVKEPPQPSEAKESEDDDPLNGLTRPPLSNPPV